VGFGGEIDGAHPNKPAFEVPPALTVSIERLDDKTQTYHSYRKERLAGNPDQKNLVYLFEDKMGETGRYRYHYQLEGTTKSGPFSMNSPYHTVDVRLDWEYIAAAFLALTGLLFWVSDRSAKLGGRVTGPKFERPQNLRRKTERIRHGDISFELKASLYFFVYKRVTLKMLAGDGVIEAGPVHPGDEKKLRLRKPHKMVAGGDQIDITAIVRIF
jgi:hypothetical protein